MTIKQGLFIPVHILLDLPNPHGFGTLSDAILDAARDYALHKLQIDREKMFVSSSSLLLLDLNQNAVAVEIEHKQNRQEAP